MSQETKMTQTTYQNTYGKFTPDVFKNDLFGTLNAFIDEQGTVWFIGAEVASILGYQDTWSAIRDLVPNYYKQVVNIKELAGNTPEYSSKGNPNKTLISEYGLISLIGRSELNNSIIIEFQKWVYEVVVDMRKYGSSMSKQLKTVLELDPNKLYDIAQERLEQNLELQRKLEEANNNIQDLQGELDYHRIMISPEGLITSTAIGKDFGLSGRALNLILRKLNIIHKSANGFEINQPFAQFGYCKKENTKLPNGQIIIQNYWTEYGRRFVYDVLCQQGLKVGANNSNVVAYILSSGNQ